jgi:hypothetical protein
MLLPGTMTALKGHPNGAVTVAVFVAAMGGMAAGVPWWAAIGAMVIALQMFHNRACATESHEGVMAHRHLEEVALNLEATKARHSDLRGPSAQEVLTLQPASRRPRSDDAPERSSDR